MCGLNNPTRRKIVCDLVRDTRATIVTLQETKLEDIDRDIVVQTLGDRFADNFVFLLANDTWLLWMTLTLRSCKWTGAFTL
jgi:hypothetical protein